MQIVVEVPTPPMNIDFLINVPVNKKTDCMVTIKKKTKA